MVILDAIMIILFFLLLVFIVAGFNRQQAQKHEERMLENEIRTKKIQDEKIKQQNELAQKIYEDKSSKSFEEK